MMLIPKKNLWKAWLFDVFIHSILKRHFQSIQFITLSDLPTKSSIVVLANHHSWWDGFLLYFINKHHFKKNFYILMSQKNYENFSWFKYMGAIGLPTSTKKIIETLNYGNSLLKNSETAIYLFPQGKMFSQHVSELDTQKGWQKMCDSQQEIVFLHQFTDYFEHKKPSVFAYADTYKGELSVLESYQISYQNAKNKHSKLQK